MTACILICFLFISTFAPRHRNIREESFLKTAQKRDQEFERSWFSDSSCYDIIIIKHKRSFTGIILFQRRRLGLGCPGNVIVENVSKTQRSWRTGVCAWWSEKADQTAEWLACFAHQYKSWRPVSNWLVHHFRSRFNPDDQQLSHHRPMYEGSRKPVWPHCNDIPLTFPLHYSRFRKPTGNRFRGCWAHLINAFLAFFFSGFADINECEGGSHSCSNNAACLDSAGSYRCECFHGYNGNGETCHSMYSKGRRWSVNRQTSWSFINQCMSFFSDKDRRTDSCIGWKKKSSCNWSLRLHLHAFSHRFCLYCVSDANECGDNLHNCSNKAICLDTIGSYYCRCFSGYHGDGKTCSSKSVS